MSKLPEFGGEYPAAVLAEEMSTPGEGQIRALITVCGNPVISCPNGLALDKALGEIDFYVAVDMYMTASSKHAHLILPPASPLERDHYDLALHAFAVRNVARYSGALFPAPANALHDGQILLGLAHALERARGNWMGRIRSSALDMLIGQSPQRAIDAALRFGAYGVLGGKEKKLLSLDALRKSPHGIDLGPLRPHGPARLKTADKKIAIAPDLLVADLSRVAESLDAPRKSDELQLIGRRHLRSNNSWMHNSPRLVRGKSRCVLFIHPTDAAARSVVMGDRVILSGAGGEIDVEIEVTDKIMPGVVSMPHGWGHGKKGARLQIANSIDSESVNDALGAQFDSLTGTVVLNGATCYVRKAPYVNFAAE